MSISSQIVIFQPSVSRNEDGGMADATVETVMSKEVDVDEEVDEEALTAAVNTEVTNAATTSIEESDGSVIDQSEVPVVESEIEVKEVSTAPSRGEPKFRLFQLRRKIGDVFDNFFATNWPNWSARLQRVVQKRVDLMEKDFDKKTIACGEFNMDQRTDDDGRYDKDNACRASKQLTRNFIHWSSIYNINCDPEKENKFHAKIVTQMEAIEIRMKKRLGCDAEITE